MKKFSWPELFTWDELWAWSEVWALLIPLTFLFFRKGRLANELRPVLIYVWAALILNAAADFIWRFSRRLDLPQWMRNNNVLYNVHSIVRLILFSWFFIRLKQPFLVNIKKILPVLFFLFVIIHFSFFSSYIQFSSLLHAAEPPILLFYCIQYYVYLSLRQEAIAVKEQPANWFVAGLTVFVSLNFFIFLFFFAMKSKNVSSSVASMLWIGVYNISYVVFCCFIAKSFYAGRS